MAPNFSLKAAISNFNRLRLGSTFQVNTRHGTAVGEYLGMEAPYGDRAVLIRHAAGTDSIAMRDITSIRAAAVLT